jgi:hypothetical protein
MIYAGRAGKANMCIYVYVCTNIRTVEWMQQLDNKVEQLDAICRHTYIVHPWLGKQSSVACMY